MKPRALPERGGLTKMQKFLFGVASGEWKQLNGICPPGHHNSRGFTTVLLSLQKKGLLEARRAKHGWEFRINPTTRCGFAYPVGTPPPKRAKYAVYYWGFVMYAMRKTSAEHMRDGLSYYEQEDAQVVQLQGSH